MKRKPNPVVAAKRGLREGHQLFVLLGKWDEQQPEMQRDIIRRFFTDEAIYEIGCLILGALVAGDKQMALTVRDAIKEADRMFSRNLEKALLIPALRYRLRNWEELLFKNRGDIHRSVDELKKGIEQHCNNGQELDQYRWSRLRRALGLPKRSSVRRDRKPVKFVEVEIIDLAAQTKNNKDAQRREREAAEANYRALYSKRKKKAVQNQNNNLVTTQAQKKRSGPAKKEPGARNGVKQCLR